MVLQQEFVNRCRKNSSYSLRAFAKSLGIEASPLSAILRGKRPLTPKTQQRLALAMGMNLGDIQQFARVTPAPSFQQLTVDNYAIISDWYHFAILELIAVKGFKANLAYVARTLGISQTEASIAVERLRRVGLLEIKNGKWVDKTPSGYVTNINGELTSQAAKKLQRQILEMSLKALEELPTAVRNHTSMTMAINPEDLSVAKEKITKFRRELCAFLNRNKAPTKVYQLAVSLFPLSKNGDPQ